MVTSKTSSVLSYYLLAAATALLVILGLAVMLSSSSIDSIKTEGDPYALFRDQVLYLVVGLVLMVLAIRARPETLKRIAPWALGVSVVFLLLVAVSPWGVSSGGNRNWLALGPISLQPSEGAKFALALYLGVALSQLRHRFTTVGRALMPAGLVAGVLLFLVLLGQDVGTAAVMILLISAAYWTAGLPLRFFALGTVAAITLVGVMVMVRKELWDRVVAWWSPVCDAASDCYQSTHGTWALASGGLWGLGPGLSREKWSYLPKAHNDFIFAILGEEFGLVGTVSVLIALALIVIAVNRIVRRFRDPFVQITAAALGAWIVGQASINIAVVTELVPVTGIPLPLVSSGGSSLIMSLVGMGVLMSFARGEPGAKEAFAARSSVARKSFAVIGRGRRRRG